MRRYLISMGFALCLVLAAGSASAQSTDPIDIATLDQEARDGILGNWIITDQSGGRTCHVTLSKESAIGGYAIEIDPACASTFPVMDEVAAWRLYENWEIVLADATRKERIRFITPDESYIATPETDGIFTISRPE